jgi:hypothetical protein
MSLRTLWSVAIAILLPVVAISFFTIRDHVLETRFGKVRMGMSPNEVANIMGPPSWGGACGAKMPTGLPARCTREIGYAVTLAPMEPTHYLIWFGIDGRVVQTALIGSP